MKKSLLPHWSPGNERQFSVQGDALLYGRTEKSPPRLVGRERDKKMTDVPGRIGDPGAIEGRRVPALFPLGTSLQVEMEPPKGGCEIPQRWAEIGGKA